MNHTPDPLTLKLSLREKCAYGMGDFGSNLYVTGETQGGEAAILQRG